MTSPYTEMYQVFNIPLLPHSLKSPNDVYNTEEKVS